MDYKGVVIDAGHGGMDGGASGNGILEKEYNLKISQYISDRLNDLGVKNKLIRDGDVTIEPSDRTKLIKDAFGNSEDVLVISNHINAGGGEGAEFIYALRNNDKFSKILVNNFEDIGRNVRKYYQRRYPSNLDKDYYFIHRDTKNTEPVIIEYGFLDNKDDADLLKKNWKSYAEAVVKSITEYIGVDYDSLDQQNVYTVKSGDTLWSIAKNNGLSVDELKDLNNLTSNKLSVGQKLLIGEDIVPVINDTYIVKKGDTLYGIAKKYGLSVDELKKYNNLNSSSLSIGQKIKIPSNEKNSYVVKSGDTLYKIAKNNGISVSDLMSLNNLNNSNLSIGQVLVLP
jgi:N-acetylmuramoyl-L-alanine amidase